MTGRNLSRWIYPICSESSISLITSCSWLSLGQWPRDRMIVPILARNINNRRREETRSLPLEHPLFCYSRDQTLQMPPQLYCEPQQTEPAAIIIISHLLSLQLTCWPLFSSPSPSKESIRPESPAGQTSPLGCSWNWSCVIDNQYQAWKRIFI